MKLRFLTSVSTADRGYFHEGRVIEIDPTAPDFSVFQDWLRRGLVEPVRLEPERAVPSRALEQAIARRNPVAKGRARRTKPDPTDTDDHGAPVICPGGTVVCLGTGPSLTPADVDACRGKATVIAVNDAWQLAPWAECLYSSDQHWYQHYGGVPAFLGRKFGIQPLDAQPEWRITVLKNAGAEGLELDPSALRHGRNSGFAAVNLAVHLGAKRILLLGYDMGPINGRSHFFGDHPPRLRNASPFGTFIALFKTMVDPLRQLGVTVVNCSRTTALDVFPRVALDKALARGPVVSVRTAAARQTSTSAVSLALR